MNFRERKNTLLTNLQNMQQMKYGGTPTTQGKNNRIDLVGIAE